MHGYLTRKKPAEQNIYFCLKNKKFKNSIHFHDKNKRDKFIMEIEYYF